MIIPLAQQTFPKTPPKKTPPQTSPKTSFPQTGPPPLNGLPAPRYNRLLLRPHGERPVGRPDAARAPRGLRALQRLQPPTPEPWPRGGGRKGWLVGFPGISWKKMIPSKKRESKFSYVFILAAKQKLERTLQVLASWAPKWRRLVDEHLVDFEEFDRVVRGGVSYGCVWC